MRLGQLSRQLEVSSDQIVKLLSAEFREVNNHPNIKLTEDELEFVMNHFKPVVEEVTTASEAEDDVLADVAPEIESAPEETPESAPEFVEELRPQVITLEEEFNSQKEDLESFKAEKPNLEGLKVVGKIELPDPVIKEQKPKEEAEDKDSDSRNSRRRERQRRSNRNGVNRATAERQKAERLAKKEKYEREQRQKELKKKHYEETVKAKLTNQTPKKKKKKAFVESQGPSPSPNQQKSQHKAAKKAGPLKRFWLWLNGAYDRFD